MTDFTKILNKAKELEEKVKESQEKIKKIKAEGISGTNSTGLVIYNPKNLAERVKSMKNKNISREQKIAMWKKEMAEREQK